MQVNFDEAESGATFEEKKRYDLVIAAAKEGTSSQKGTPYLKLELQTEDGESAYDHTIWLTPKALYRAQEWFEAMGLPSKGKVSIDPDRLPGIRLSAVCVLEKYIGTDEKEHKAVKWSDPLKKVIGKGSFDEALNTPDAKPVARPELTDEIPF